MPLTLLILSGLSLFKLSRDGISSLENLYQPDFDFNLDSPVDWDGWGISDEINEDSNGAITNESSFIDELSIKESLFAFGLFSVILFSKPWK